MVSAVFRNSGLMQIKNWNENNVDGRIETPIPVRASWCPPDTEVTHESK
jgi:hypothetical protein